jgi:hypothetical protein
MKQETQKRIIAAGLIVAGSLIIAIKFFWTFFAFACIATGASVFYNQSK